jgi:hypothetical protein
MLADRGLNVRDSPLRQEFLFSRLHLFTDVYEYRHPGMEKGFAMAFSR